MYTCDEFKQLVTSDTHPLVRLADAFRDILSVAGSPYIDFAHRLLPGVCEWKFGILEGKFYDLVLLSHLTTFKSQSLTRAMYYILAEKTSEMDLLNMTPLELFLAAGDSRCLHRVLPAIHGGERMSPQSGLETHNMTSNSFPYQDLYHWLMDNYDTVSWYLIRIGPIISVLRDIVLVIYFLPQRQKYYPQSGFYPDLQSSSPQSSSSGGDSSILSGSRSESMRHLYFTCGSSTMVAVAPILYSVFVSGHVQSEYLALSARLSLFVAIPYIMLGFCIFYRDLPSFVRQSGTRRVAVFDCEKLSPASYKMQAGDEKKVVHTMAPTICNESGEPTYPPSSLMRSVTPKISNQRSQVAPRVAQTAEAAVKAPSVFRTVGNTDFFGD